jgi:hypothetical protein
MTDKDREHDKGHELIKPHEPGKEPGKKRDELAEPGKHTPSQPRETATSQAAATGVPPLREKTTDVTGGPGTPSQQEWRIEDEPSYWSGVRAAQSAIAREDAPFGEDDYQRELWLKGWDFAQGDDGKHAREPERLEDKSGEHKP